MTVSRKRWPVSLNAVSLELHSPQTKEVWIRGCCAFPFISLLFGLFPPPPFISTRCSLQYHSLNSQSGRSLQPIRCHSIKTLCIEILWLQVKFGSVRFPDIKNICVFFSLNLCFPSNVLNLRKLSGPEAAEGIFTYRSKRAVIGQCPHPRIFFQMI